MKVKFLPQGKEIEITPEKTLLQAALENGVEIRSVCKGQLSCAECRVKIVEGEANILPPSKAELNLLGLAWQIDSRRYSCQVRCFGDVTVDLTEQIQRAETARKNIRGFKSAKPAESHAVVDTMILTEKIETPNEQRPPREPREPRQQDQRQPREGGGQRNQQQGQGREGRSQDPNKSPDGKNSGRGQRRGRRGGRGRDKS